jgi:hypothetical protein
MHLNLPSPAHISRISDEFFTAYVSLGRVLSYGKNLEPMGWSWSGGGGYGKGSNNGFSRFGRGDDGGGSGILSHSSTVERLYAWEKKLFLDVKVAFICNPLYFTLFANSDSSKYTVIKHTDSSKCAA